MSAVVELRDTGRYDLARAGGKGANLGELLRAGFPVPDGFVVTTEAYRRAVQVAGLDEVAAQPAPHLRSALAEAVVPDDVRADVLAAYRALGGGPVAVRSSATAEDLPGAAFAGQQDTYLDVAGESAVLDAVRRCWGSLWTDRAVAYRARLRIPPEDVALAVVVQRMVPAEFAGVMFTADPVSGERDLVVVDVAPGLGEAVVSGRVTPDHYVLDGRGAIRERSLVPYRPHLPDGAVRELAALGRSAATHFGTPQDVEWAYAGGEVVLTQARPMTALPPPPMHLNAVQRRIGAQLLDYVTERPYPLDLTAWTLPAIGRLVERMLAEIPGLRVEVGEMFPERDGVVERFVPPRPHPTRAVVTAPARLLPKARRHRPAAWTGDARFGAFLDGVQELRELDLAALGWAELAGLPRRAFAVHEAVADLRVDYLPRAGLDLLRLRAVLAVLGLRRLFPLLVVGGRTRTEDANAALADLARQVRDDERLRAEVTATGPVELADRIGRDPELAGFRTALERFRAEYGHRETTSLLLLSAPTWGEDLPTVLGLVRMLVDEPATARADTARTRERARHVLLEHGMVRATGSARAVDRILEGARAGIAFREDTHFYATAVLPVVRGALLEAGARLAAAGVLTDRDDVLHLRLAEIEAIPEPGLLPAEDADRIRTAARRRAALRAQLRSAPLIAPGDVFRPRGGGADVLVSGTPAGSGRATGRVRLVAGPPDFASLRPGEILVCPYTNPAWTPLFQRAAAVVVDSGGLGSHAAIVAREYGIPAVMGTGRGTAILATGRMVTVDGDHGLVTDAAATQANGANRTSP